MAEAEKPESGLASRYGVLSRTWELELLISGAVFFALLQLPQRADDLFWRLEPNVSRDAWMLVFVAYFYARAIIFVLITSFLVHLVARAYWVGLVGLDSVFPRGPQWDRTRYGPIVRDVFRARLPATPKLIESVDNFCSAIFSFAFGTVFTFLASVAVAVVAGALAYLLHATILRGVDVATLYTPMFMFLALYPVPFIVADRRFGARLDPDSFRARAIRAIVRTSYLNIALPLYGPGTITIFSNVRRRVIYPVFYALTIGFAVIFMVDTLARRGAITILRTPLIPADTAFDAVDYRFYESHPVDERRDVRLPHIQSEFITDPFIRLTIPYYARRDAASLRAYCPALGREEPAARAVIACYARLRQITIDGVPVPASDLQLFTDRTSGVRGVVAYIPVQDLPRGRHLLLVQQMPRAPTGTASADKEEQPPYRIWFWK